MERITFSVLLVRQAIPRQFDPAELTRQTISAILNIRIVQYSEFKTYTQSKAIPRYVLLAKEEMRKTIESTKELMMNDKKYDKFLSMKDGYKAFKSKETDNFDAPKMTDPSYAVVDIHTIEGVGIAIVLNRNPGIPMHNHLLLKTMAKRLSRHFTCDVLAVEKAHNNTFIEHTSQFSSGQTVFNVTTPAGANLLTAYLQKTKVDINKLLGQMDSNVDILMSPHDLDDYRKIHKKLELSKAYLESLGLPDKNPDQNLKNDYQDLLSEIKHTVESMKKVSDMVTQEPNLETIYIKFNDPKQLEQYAMRPLIQNKTEKLN